jgi:hypothetical protein
VAEDFAGGSDHASFENKGIPNLMFICWPDDVYHTPADTAAHVSKRNLFDTARLTALITLKLAEAEVAMTALTISSSSTSNTSTASTHNAETLQTSLELAGTANEEAVTATSLQVGGWMLTTDLLIIAGMAFVVVLAVVTVLYFRRRRRDGPGS